MFCVVNFPIVTRTLDFSTDVAVGSMLASIEVVASFSRATNLSGLKPICLSMQLTDPSGNTMNIFANKILE